MRKITILCVGKVKKAQSYLNTGILEYEKRLMGQVQLDWVELPEKTGNPGLTLPQIVEQESKDLLAKTPTNAYTILLDETGQLLDSSQWAQLLFDSNPPYGGAAPQSAQPIIIIIGGANGTSPALKQKANLVVSLSKMTFPHQLVRLILAEQTYRAWCIHQGKPYHRA